MTIENIKQTLPIFANDIRINLQKVLTEEGAPNLTLKEIFIIAIASAHTSRNLALLNAIVTDAEKILSQEEVAAAKTASTLMAMNNIYYRFLHQMEDKSYRTMPVQLRMQALKTNSIPKKTFELASLAASAINGCGMCMNAHADELQKEDVSKLAIQSSIRIASVIHATSLVT